MSEYHTPVMLDESISALVTNPSGTYADVTFGGGGHTAELLSRLNEDGHVIAFDRDSDAINNRIDDPRLTMVRADFRFIHNFVLNEAHETEDQTLKENSQAAWTASSPTSECHPTSSTRRREDSPSATTRHWT